MVSRHHELDEFISTQRAIHCCFMSFLSKVNFFLYSAIWLPSRYKLHIWLRYGCQERFMVVDRGYRICFGRDYFAWDCIVCAKFNIACRHALFICLFQLSCCQRWTLHYIKKANSGRLSNQLTLIWSKKCELKLFFETIPLLVITGKGFRTFHT